MLLLTAVWMFIPCIAYRPCLIGSLLLLARSKSSFHFRRVGMTSNSGVGMTSYSGVPEGVFATRRRWSQMYIKASTICDKVVVTAKKGYKNVMSLGLSLVFNRGRGSQSATAYYLFISVLLFLGREGWPTG